MERVPPVGFAGGLLGVGGWVFLRFSVAGAEILLG